MTRVLLSYIGYPVGAGKFAKKALRNLGYEVIHLGPDAKGTLPWAPGQDFSEYADSPDLAIEYPCNSYPIESVLEKTGKVDLVIQMDANFHLVGKAPVPNVVWMIDNHVADYKLSAENADILFGAHSWGYQHEDRRFVWLPCAYSPTDHNELHTEKKLDLVFAGVLYEHRVRLLERLAKIGRVGVGMGVLGKEYNEFNNSARIGLCLSACGDVPMRVFENAAQGLCIFCDLQKDLDKLGLKDGTHYIGFGSPDEALEKFRYMLLAPEVVSQIAKSGKEALKNETYEARAQTMFNYL